MATLCSLLPVKYISAAPKLAGSTTRKSACIAPASSTVRTDALVSPCTSTSAAAGCSTNAAKIASRCSGPPPQAMRMSMSPMVSLPRRRLPAYSIRSTPGSGRRSSTSSVASAWAVPMRVRWLAVSANLRFFCRFSIFFLPKPLSSANSPVASFASRSLSDSTPASCQSWATVLGPSPGTFITCGSPAGICAMSCWWSAIWPVSRNSTIRSAVPLPMPSSLGSRAGSISATSRVMSSRMRATLVKALTLNRLPPVISVRSAISEKMAANWALCVAIAASYGGESATQVTPSRA